MSAGSESPVQPGDPSKYSESSEFVLWSKYEDVAMHFNDLIIKLRTQALAGLAGVITVSGLAVNFVGRPSSHTEWEVLLATVVFLTIAWVALWVLDLCYYDKLLEGAVKALYEHEEETQKDGRPIGKQIRLSTLIGACAKGHRRIVMFFYGLVFGALLLGIVFTGVKWASSPSSAPKASDKLKTDIDRSAGEKLELKLGP